MAPGGALTVTHAADSAGIRECFAMASATVYDANTMLLLHFDGPNGSTTFVDSSNAARQERHTATQKFPQPRASLEERADRSTEPIPA